MKHLDFGIGIPIPLDAATSTWALLAKRRVGKSNAAVVMFEAYYDAAIPVCAIDPKGDWYGVRIDGPTKKGLEVVIFGGLHADLPLEPTAGAFIADLIAAENISCVLDVSQFSEGEKVRFLTDFARRLLLVNRDPRHLFFEEAEDYIPQKPFHEQARCVAAFQKLVKNGGFRGIGSTLISHRSADVNKSVLNQNENLIVMRTTAPHDQDAVGAWLRHQSIQAEILATLSGLGNGEAWLASPQMLGLKEPIRIQFPRRGTFDSGETPKVGAKRSRAPKVLAPVDFAAIEAKMGEAIERAKAEDPKALRERIAELERVIKIHQSEIVRMESKKPQPSKGERVEVPIFSASQAKALEVAVQKLNVSAARAKFDRLESVANGINLNLKRLEEVIGSFVSELRSGRTPPAAQEFSPEEYDPRRGPGGFEPTLPGRTSIPTDDVRLGARAHRITVSPSNGHGPAKLPKGALEMVRQIAAMQRPLSDQEVGGLAGLPHRKSTYRTYRSLLKMQGYVVAQDDGRLALTQKGLDVAIASGPIPHPKSAAELFAYWKARLPVGAVKMLEHLMSIYPRTISKRALGDRTDLPAEKSTFRTYMSLLKTRSLVTITKDEASASAMLFGGGR